MSNSKRGVILKNTSRQERISEYCSLPAALREKTTGHVEYIKSLVSSSKSVFSYLSSSFFEFLLPKTGINNVIRYAKIEEGPKTTEKPQLNKNEIGVNTDLEIKRPGSLINDLLIKKRKLNYNDAEVQTNFPYAISPVAKKQDMQKSLRTENANTDMETKGTDDENEELGRTKGKQVVKQVRRAKKGLDRGLQLDIIPEEPEKKMLKFNSYAKKNIDLFNRSENVAGLLNKDKSAGINSGFYQGFVGKSEKNNETENLSIIKTQVIDACKKNKGVLDKVQLENFEKTQPASFKNDQPDYSEIKQQKELEKNENIEKIKVVEPVLVESQNLENEKKHSSGTILGNKIIEELHNSIFNNNSQILPLKKNNEADIHNKIPANFEILPRENDAIEEKDRKDQEEKQKTPDPISKFTNSSSNPFLNTNLVKTSAIPFIFGDLNQKSQSLIPTTETFFKENTKNQPLFNTPESSEKNLFEKSNLCDIDMGNISSGTSNAAIPSFVTTSVCSSVFDGQSNPISSCLPNSFTGGSLTGNSDKLFEYNCSNSTNNFDSTFETQSGAINSFMQSANLLEQPKPTLFSGSQAPKIGNNENKGFSLGIISSKKPKK